MTNRDLNHDHDHDHGTSVMADGEWERQLRARGYRITPQRQLVLEAVETLRHATPDELLVQVQKTAAGVNLSTIYRTLEVLEEVGLVSHAHIGHGAPTYHAVEETTHIHLVCDGCEQVISIDSELAEPFVRALRELASFDTDIAHFSVHGRCSECRAATTLA